MLELNLIKPCLEKAAALERYKLAFFERGEKIYGASLLERVPAAEWVELCGRMETPEYEESSGQSSREHFLLTNELSGEILGICSFKHSLKGDFAEFGHISYSILPGERGNGYGKYQLSLCLDKCREYGLDKALICCDIDNEASRRTILACGGKYIDTAALYGQTVERYLLFL